MWHPSQYSHPHSLVILRERVERTLTRIHHRADEDVRPRAGRPVSGHVFQACRTSFSFTCHSEGARGERSEPSATEEPMYSPHRGLVCAGIFLQFRRPALVQFVPHLVFVCHPERERVELARQARVERPCVSVVKLDFGTDLSTLRYASFRDSRWDGLHFSRPFRTR
jgi:hypothetical protein